MLLHLAPLSITIIACVSAAAPLVGAPLVRRFFLRHHPLLFVKTPAARLFFFANYHPLLFVKTPAARVFSSSLASLLCTPLRVALHEHALVWTGLHERAASTGKPARACGGSFCTGMSNLATNKRGAEGEAPLELDELCPVCGAVSIEPPNVRFELQCDKQCVICAVCFSRSQAARQCSPTTTCPDCQGTCTQWKVLFNKVVESSTRSTRRQTSEAEEELSAKVEADKKLDPVRCHINFPLAQRDNFFGITLTQSVNGTVVPRSVMFATAAPTSAMSEKEIRFLEDLFQVFYGLLVVNDRKERDCQFYPGGDLCPKGNDDGWTLRQLACEDYSVLRRAVHALAYGEVLRDCPGFYNPAAPNWERLSITTFALTDIIRYLRSQNPGLVKSTIGALLPAHTVHTGVYQFLNQIGVSHNYRTMKRQEKRTYATKMDGRLWRQHQPACTYYKPL